METLSKMAATLSKSPQDNILCCPICMDIYKTPRMLPCQHTLCEACLHSYIVNKSRERVLVSEFPCPVCRASTPAPRTFTRIDTWANLFPLNYLLVSLLDSSFQQILEKAEPHSETCVDHVGKPVEFFCLEHNVKLCSKCFKNSHRHCDVLDIEEHIDFTSRHNIVTTDVDNLISYLNDIIAHLKANIEQLTEQKCSILKEVKDFKNKIESLIHAFEMGIEESVNSQHDAEVTALKAQCEKYEKIKTEIDGSGECLSKLPIAGGFAQSIQMIHTIENEIKGQLSYIQGCHSNVRSIKLEFAIDNKLLSFVNAFSHIESVSIHHFEPALQDPPELLSRECSPKEFFGPSRDMSTTIPEDIFTQSPNHHISIQTCIPETAVTNAIDQKTNVMTQRQKEIKKRSKTVPMQSTAPTPVVRPRPERPNIKVVPFFPKSCSSPVSLSHGTVTHSTVVDKQTQNEQRSNESNNDNVILITGENNHQTGARCNGSTYDLSSAIQKEPSSSESQVKHRAFQYVNVAKCADGSRSMMNSNKNETPEECAEEMRQLFAVRSMSISSAHADSNNVMSPPENQILSNFEVATPTIQLDVDSPPLYENSHFTQVSTPSLSNTEQSNKSNSKQELSKLKHASKVCTKLKEVRIKIEEDLRDCTITGSVELPDKRLVLVDCNNSRIKLFSADFVKIAHLDMAKEPWNVTSTSANEIAVSIPLDKTIHIIRVSASGLGVQRCIVTRKECWGICYMDKKFIITTKDDGNQVAFLDEHGRELQIINFAARENPNILRPVSLTSIHSENMLYICCEGKSGTNGSVVKMSTRGDLLHVFANKDLDRPYGAAVDKDMNVFITAIRSANVLLLSEGNASVTTILSRDLGLSRPQHLHLTTRQEKTILMLTERRSDTASLYYIQ